MLRASGERNGQWDVVLTVPVGDFWSDAQVRWQQETRGDWPDVVLSEGWWVGRLPQRRRDQDGSGSARTGSRALLN